MSFIPSDYGRESRTTMVVRVGYPISDLELLCSVFYERITFHTSTLLSILVMFHVG